MTKVANYNLLIIFGKPNKSNKINLYSSNELQQNARKRKRTKVEAIYIQILNYAGHNMNFDK